MSAVIMENSILELPLEVKTGAAPGSFSGYGAIFGNVDRDGDIVAKGAFAESLKGGVPALLWQHNAKEPIGRFDVVREDEKGLYVEGRLAMTGRGLEAYALLKMGALDGLSIGFVTREAARDAGTGVRTITKADLMEISLVTFPANDLARVGSVKGHKLQPDIGDIRSFEHFLREHGFSRSRAKAIAAKGFSMPAGQEHRIADLVATLKVRQARIECKDRFSALIMPHRSKSFGPANFMRLLGKRFKVDVTWAGPDFSGRLEARVSYNVPRPGLLDGDQTITKTFEVSDGRSVLWLGNEGWDLSLGVTNIYVTVLNKTDSPKDVSVLVDRF